ncbi:MAG: aminodeoxychorismate/anthranilate synthase component II [Candidatus Omnitrophica bacterium]|nr:aminodeoxychorismate/anthranilate synthase component II [Candidatus Omnitrophota bacterium]MCM8807335.1 aminodeoxychorismate/anthranilate synthase component II [Candidatus Omnitrophota bacterium]
MILMIDNYDSFVYNLVQYFGELGEKIIVYRNDEITIKKIEKLKFDRIVISPGPKRPENAGISCEIIDKFKGKVPILGVCLGHQCIGYVFGGKITYAKKLMHGKTSLIYHNGKTIFKNVGNPFIATRYHSLVVERETLPDCLEIIAWTEDNEIMGIKHKNYNIFGVQFHPESILTKEGKKILKNFLNIK